MEPKGVKQGEEWEIQDEEGKIQDEEGKRIAGFRAKKGRSRIKSRRSKMTK